MTTEPQFPNPIEQWWGYHSDFQWVVLDRAMSRNRPGLVEPLLFIRCLDWQFFTEERERWKRPLFIYLPRYLELLSEDAARAALQSWQSVHSKFIVRQPELARQVITKKHTEFLIQFGITEVASLVKCFDENRRITHCWRCKDHLDSWVDLQCSRCTWILCSCGACGCAYNGPIYYYR